MHARAWTSQFFQFGMTLQTTKKRLGKKLSLLSCSQLQGWACFALVLQAGKTVSYHIITLSAPRTRSKEREAGRRRLKCENTKQKTWNLWSEWRERILSLEKRGLERVRGGEKVMIWHDTVFSAWRTSAKHAHPSNGEQLNQHLHLVLVL